MWLIDLWLVLCLVQRLAVSLAYFPVILRGCLWQCAVISSTPSTFFTFIPPLKPPPHSHPTPTSPHSNPQLHRRNTRVHLDAYIDATTATAINATGGVFVASQVQKGGCDGAFSTGYHLFVDVIDKRAFIATNHSEGRVGGLRGSLGVRGGRGYWGVGGVIGVL